MSKRKFFLFVMAVAMIFTVCTVSASAAEESVLCGHADAYCIRIFPDEYIPVPMAGVCYDLLETKEYYCPACGEQYVEEAITRVYHYVEGTESRECNGDGTDTVIEYCTNINCGSEFIDEFAQCRH